MLFGDGSIHHMCVICYQNISVDKEEGVNNSSYNNSNDANKKYNEEFVSVTVNKRKPKTTDITSSISNDSLNDNLEPYFKKPTMNMSSFLGRNVVCSDSY